LLFHFPPEQNSLSFQSEDLQHKFADFEDMYVWVVPKMVDTPIAGWFILENPIKMDEWYPYFSNPPCTCMILHLSIVITTSQLITSYQHNGMNDAGQLVVHYNIGTLVRVQIDWISN
jgi:hypothetical protein